MVFSLAMLTACKKEKKDSDALPCDDLKKKMDEKAELFGLNFGTESCVAFANAIDEYVDCLPDFEMPELKKFANDIRATCP